jgi:hypothetical protein
VGQNDQRLFEGVHAHQERGRGVADRERRARWRGAHSAADNTSDFEALRSRQRQAEAILVAYDIMEADGQDVRPEPLEERRKRLAKLLGRKTKAMREGIQLSEAITGDEPPSFVMRAGWSSKASFQTDRLTICERQDAGMAEDEESRFRR